MLSRYDYFKANDLDSALTYLKENAGAKVLAGGTDLLVVLRKNVIEVEHMLDIKGIEELKKLEYTPGQGLYIGANVTVNELAENAEVQEKYPAILHGSNNLASYQLRNRATAVGNMCNASPGADLAPAFLVYDAEIVLQSADGERKIPLQDFFKGVKKTDLQDGEMVTAIIVPDVEQGEGSAFEKMARIKGHDLAIAGAAARVTADKKVKVAMNAVAITPIRLTGLEEELNNRELNDETFDWIEDVIGDYIKPIDDVRSTKEYRLAVSGVLVRRALEKALNKEA